MQEAGAQDVQGEVVMWDAESEGTEVDNEEDVVQDAPVLQRTELTYKVK